MSLEATAGTRSAAFLPSSLCHANTMRLTTHMLMVKLATTRNDTTMAIGSNTNHTRAWRWAAPGCSPSACHRLSDQATSIDCGNVSVRWPVLELFIRSEKTSTSWAASPDWRPCHCLSPPTSPARIARSCRSCTYPMFMLVRSGTPCTTSRLGCCPCWAPHRAACRPAPWCPGLSLLQRWTGIASHWCTRDVPARCNNASSTPSSLSMPAVAPVMAIAAPKHGSLVNGGCSSERRRSRK